MPSMAYSEPNPIDISTVGHLKTLLNEGIVQPAASREISKTTVLLRLHKPGSPIPDYASGLVWLTRNEFSRAFDCFEAALEQDDAYLPAWKVQLRTRLIRNQPELFKTDCLKLARLVGDPRAWDNPKQRDEAAKWLGQIAGFLTLPDVKLMTEKERTYFEWLVESKFPTELHPLYMAGRQTVQKEYDNLHDVFEEDFQKQMDQLDEELEALEDRKLKLDRRVDSLKLMEGQLKIRLTQRQKKAERQLKGLGKGYESLNKAARSLLQLMQQTQSDVGRLYIELASQGIIGIKAEQQPVMIQLRQELIKYLEEYRQLARRGAQVRSKGYQVIADRTEAIRRYQRVKGNIQRQVAGVYQRQNRLDAASEKIRREDQQALKESLRKQLADPANFFELDEQTELTRLIEQAGGTLKTN